MGEFVWGLAIALAFMALIFVATGQTAYFLGG